MLRFDVITLFPELFGPHLQHGVTRRAFGQSIDVRLWPLRDHADDAYRRIDDRPYGGGPGMVMMAEPLMRALAAVRADRIDPAPVIHFTPAGHRLDQEQVRQWAASAGAVLICGRYEGVDQRFIDAFVTHEVSLGDFVLSGGELPALALIDAVARLQGGVLTVSSHEQDSFSDGLLEGPSYSRPERLTLPQGSVSVPEVLLSGHHGEIARWRRERSLELSWRRRPELVIAAHHEGRLTSADLQFLARLGAKL